MKRFRRILNWIFASVLTLMLITAVCIKDNTTFKVYDFDTDLTHGWAVVEADGSHATVKFPYQFQDGENTVQLIRKLPKVSDYTVLMVKCNYNSITAYIDGEEIYHSLPDTFGPVETDLGHYAALIPLSEEHSGKDIVLNIVERSSGYSTDIRYIRLTSLAQYGFQKLEESAVRMLIAIVLLVCAFACFVAWLILWKKNGLIPEENYHPLLWIGLFATSVGIWIFSEPHIWATSTGHFATSGLFNYLALSLMPVSLLGILKSICTKKLNSLRWLVIIAKILLIIEWLLFLTGTADLSDILLVLQLSCIIAVIIFGLFIVRYRKLFLVGNAIRIGIWIVLALAMLTFVTYTNGGDWMPWALCSVVAILASVMVSTFLNISYFIKEMAQTKEYKEYALTDIMTGLKSRYAYTIFEAQQKIGLPSQDLCLVYLDINLLKSANDSFGHIAGDELIIATSKYIKDAFGDVAECFRMGGDEFLVAITAAPNVVEERIALFNRLTSQWSGRYNDRLSVAYGIAAAKDYPTCDFDELHRIADKKMYQQKKQSDTSQ